MTTEERRVRNRRALKLLLAVFVVAGIVQAIIGPKRLREARIDPQTARERAEENFQEKFQSCIKMRAAAMLTGGIPDEDAKHRDDWCRVWAK
jgi:hypothetical protein